MIVVAVSYLNTIPFIWGIQRAAVKLRDCGSIDLVLKVPSMCAKMAIENKADIALVPVAEIPKIKNYKIITDFCLSAEGAVDTVALLYNCKNIEDIETIYLDSDSKTSVQLAKVLAQRKWKITPKWVDGINSQVKNNEAVIAIGDKVFELQKQFSGKLDLAVEWQEMTGLPFVFAAWVGCTEEGVKNEQNLNEALKYGVENIENAIEEFAPNNFYAKEYLTKNIKFHLSSQKIAAMKLFWEYINPG